MIGISDANREVEFTVNVNVFLKFQTRHTRDRKMVTKVYRTWLW